MRMVGRTRAALALASTRCWRTMLALLLPMPLLKSSNINSGRRRGATWLRPVALGIVMLGRGCATTTTSIATSRKKRHDLLHTLHISLTWVALHGWSVSCRGRSGITSTWAMHLLLLLAGHVHATEEVCDAARWRCGTASAPQSRWSCLLRRGGRVGTAFLARFGVGAHGPTQLPLLGSKSCRLRLAIKEARKTTSTAWQTRRLDGARFSTPFIALGTG